MNEKLDELIALLKTENYRYAVVVAEYLKRVLAMEHEDKIQTGPYKV